MSVSGLNERDTPRHMSAIFDEHPANAGRDSEAQLWQRVGKISEENGKVIEALIGATGGNPRKGVTCGMEEVSKELLDVAVTALCADEHVHGNDGKSFARLETHLYNLRCRMAEHLAAERAAA